MHEPWQNGVAPVHFVPQTPQFCGSLLVLTQLPEQQLKPAEHAGLQANAPLEPPLELPEELPLEELEPPVELFPLEPVPPEPLPELLLLLLEPGPPPELPPTSTEASFPLLVEVDPAHWIAATIMPNFAIKPGPTLER